MAEKQEISKFNTEFNPQILGVIIRRHWFLPFLWVAIFTTLGFFYLRYTKPTYRSDAKIQIIEEDRVNEVLGQESIIKGDQSLNKRSMKKLIELMSEFGAEFLPKNKFNFPLKIISTEMPVGINYKAGVSAQLKSATILAGLNSFGNTEIIENEKSRDHTENMLLHNANSIKIKNGKSNGVKP